MNSAEEHQAKRYFLDTEFIEDGKTIELISIGIVCDDGREFYRCNAICDLSRANLWVRDNVIPKLPHRNDVRWASHYDIARLVERFIEPSDPKPEIWGYYADYDWVVVCQLFGLMVDLPKHFPKFCMDLKQLAVMCGDPQLPQQGKGEHDALEDARWNRLAFDFLVAHR